MVKKINEQEFQSMSKAGTIFVDFSAKWCGPCRMVAPVVEELSEDYAGKVAFYNVDVDECPSLAAAFSIQSIPALVMLKDGKFADMQVGFMPKPALKSFIDKNC